MVLFLLVSLLVALATSILIYLKSIDVYWERRGVYTYRPKSEDENVAVEAYKDIKAKGLKGGAYVKSCRPRYMPTDLDDLKAILIKDADHFVNRGMYCNPKTDPFSASLVKLENAEWKAVRNVLSPIFSSGEFHKLF